MKNSLQTRKQTLSTRTGRIQYMQYAIETACQGNTPTTMTRYLPFYRYKKHLGLDVNVKNARVRARAQACRYNVIPILEDGNYNCYPRGVPDSTFRGGRKIFKYIGGREW